MDEAIEILDPARILDEDMFRVLKAVKIAVAALRAQQDAQPPNAPLTPEELLKLDGEPVWVQYGQYDGEWVIVAWNIYDAISYTRKAPFKLSIYSYGDTWLAYRRRPEEVTE